MVAEYQIVIAVFQSPHLGGKFVPETKAARGGKEAKSRIVLESVKRSLRDSPSFPRPYM